MRDLTLLELPLKPMLYFFEAALILTIYHSLTGNFKKIMFETKGKTIIKLCCTLLTLFIRLMQTLLRLNDTSLNTIQ